MKAEIPWTFVIFIAIVTVRGYPDCPEKTDLISDYLPDTPIWFNPTIDFDKYGLGLISGELKLKYPLVKGLETIVGFLYPDCISSYPLINVTLDLSAEFLELSSWYEIDAHIAQLLNSSSVPVFGDGDLFVRLDGVQLTLVAQAEHDSSTDGLDGESGTIELSFERLSLHVQQLEICGHEITNKTWVSISELAKPAFDLFWAQCQSDIDGLVSDVLRFFFGDCTLKQLIDGAIIGVCLDFEEWLPAAKNRFQIPSTACTQDLVALIQQTLPCEPSSSTTIDRTTSTSTARTTTYTKPTEPSSAMKCRHGFINIALMVASGYYYYYMAESAGLSGSF